MGLLRRRAQMLDLRVRRGQVLRRGFHQRPSAESGERGEGVEGGCASCVAWLVGAQEKIRESPTN